MIELIYGGRLRWSELIRLQVKDIDCAAETITVRSGKGDKDRVTLLPRRLHADLRGRRAIRHAPYRPAIIHQRGQVMPDQGGFTDPDGRFIEICYSYGVKGSVVVPAAAIGELLCTSAIL